MGRCEPGGIEWYHGRVKEELDKDHGMDNLGNIILSSCGNKDAVLLKLLVETRTSNMPNISPCQHA